MKTQETEELLSTSWGILPIAVLWGKWNFTLPTILKVLLMYEFELTEQVRSMWWFWYLRKFFVLWYLFTYLPIRIFGLENLRLGNNLFRVDPFQTTGFTSTNFLLIQKSAKIFLISYLLQNSFNLFWTEIIQLPSHRGIIP